MRAVHSGAAHVAFDDEPARSSDLLVLSETMPGTFQLGIPFDWVVPEDAARVTVTLPDGQTYGGAIRYRRPGTVVFGADA